MQFWRLATNLFLMMNMMRKTSEDFHNLFRDKFLKRYSQPVENPWIFVWWERFLIVLYDVAADMTGRCYIASEPTVAELLEEWSDVFTCRLYERLGDVIDGAANLDFPILPSLDNLQILREYCNLIGIDYPLEMMNNEKISD